MKRVLSTAFAGVGALSVIFACSSDPEAPLGSGAIDAASADTAAVSDDAAAVEDTGSTAKDAGTDGPGATGKTSVVVTIKNVSRTVVRAQFGKSAADAAKESFHTESHEGGDAACPTQASPTPKRTLIVSGVPRGAPGTKFTKSDGVSAAFFDFTGYQLGNVPLVKASAVTVTIVAIDVGASTTDGAGLVEIDVDATFPDGTAKGRVAATYCASLSD